MGVVYCGWFCPRIIKFSHLVTLLAWWNLPGSPDLRVKGHTQYLCGRRESLGTRLVIKVCRRIFLLLPSPAVQQSVSAHWTVAMGCAVTEERYKELINYIRGSYINLSIPSLQIRNVAFQMHAHEYCGTVSSLDRFFYWLIRRSTTYIISYSKYLPTAM